VAHACNTSYSGGRDQEDSGSKIAQLAQANSLRDPVSKIAVTERTGRVVQGEGPEFESK
jgi:hypothetical protein